MKNFSEKREKTKQRIIDAFWVLVKKNGISKVNVSAITKMADINRGDKL